MLIRRLKQRQKGDTLIEVLFAVTVFSLVAVGTLSIMNQGSAIAERALETTLVRQQIDGQAEALRFLNTSFIAAYKFGQPYSSYAASTAAGQWAAIDTNDNPTTAMPFGAVGTDCPTPPSGSFVIDTHNAKFVAPTDGKLTMATTYAKLNYDTADSLINAEGIWIEAVRSPASSDPSQTTSGYIDFHINACWSAAGLSVPQTIGTIVRLYEPRG